MWSVFVGLLGLSFSRQSFLDSLDNLISVGIDCDCFLIGQFHVDVHLFSAGCRLDCMGLSVDSCRVLLGKIIELVLWRLNVVDIKDLNA